MRKQMLLLAATSVALVVSLPCHADYPAEVLNLAPINYWRLNEAGPVPPPVVLTNLGSLGAADNGSPAGGAATLGVAGVLPGNTAISVSGNSRAAIPYDAALNPPTFSAEGWFKPNTIGTTTCIMSQFVEGTRSGWLVYQVAGGWSFRLYDENGQTVSLNITTTNAPVVGQWYHIAVTFDGTIGIIYVNGAPTSDTATGYVPNVSNPFAIGARADVAFGWDGTADEVAIYSGAISPATVAAHYSAVTTNAAGYASQILASNPLGYWRLDQAPYVPLMAGNTGTRGTAANGAYNPNATISAGLRPPAFPGFEAVNTAPTFDGFTGSISCGTNASLSGPTDFSVSAWIKTSSTTTNGTIAQQRNVDGAVSGFNGEYKLSVNADGTVQFFLYKDDYQFNYATTATVNDGNWHQVVAVRKGLDGFTYVDGALAGNQTGTEVRELVGGIATFIGRDMRDFVDAFNGEIDEVAVFDKALGQGAVLSLYYTAIGSNAAPVMASDPPAVSPAGTIYASTPFTITADVAGTPPLAYQWRKDGVVVSTNRDFTKASAAISDNGNYDVIITNAYGSVTSAVVAITINPAQPAQIVTQPQARSVYPSGTARFSVEATGTPPLTYQWKKAGVNITGETNQTLVITNVSAASAASYSVGVTNVAGGVVSQGASLTLRPPPAAGSYESVIVNSAPIAYWRLGESTGTTAFDYVGGNDGYYTNVTLGQPGYSSTDPDTAAAFDVSQLSVVGVPGLSDFIYAGATPTFTLEAWANFTDLTTNQRLFSKGGPGFNGIGFGVFDNGTVLRFTTYGIQDFNLTLPAPLDPGVWYHIVGVANGGTFYFYTNGQPAGSIAFTGASVASAANPPFAIGRNGLGTDEAVNGVIDEPAVYNKALTAQEILAHYTAATGQTVQDHWSENFDSYANGSQGIGQGGWQGWGGDTTVGALVTNAQAFSAPNSIRIYGTALTPGNYSDFVHQFSGYTNGQWVFSARQYIPSGTVGTNFFILLDNYADPDGPFNWAIQTAFNLTTGNLNETMGPSSTLRIVRDQWVELRYEIDLTANSVRAFYNGTNFSTHVWQTDDFGLNEIRAIDLYSDVSGPVFYDDLSLTRAQPSLVVVSIRQSGNTLILSWPAGGGMYTVQSNPDLNPSAWVNLSPQPPINQVGSNYEAVIQIGGPQSFYRLAR